MKTLVIIRHAKTESMSVDGNDYTRELTRRGRRDATTLAQALPELIPHVDQVLCSSARRARQTLDLLSPSLSCQPANIVLDEELYLASWSVLETNIMQLPPNAHCAVLIAHNPGLFDLVNYLASDPIQSLPTCGTVVLSLNCELWEDVHAGCATATHIVFPEKDE